MECAELDCLHLRGRRALERLHDAFLFRSETSIEPFVFGLAPVEADACDAAH
jgi:hypothetical protein